MKDQVSQEEAVAQKAGEQSPTPSEQKPVETKKNYTQEEHQTELATQLKAQFNTLNATMSTQGAELKRLKGTEDSLSKSQATVKTLRKEADDREDEAYKDDKPAFDAIKQKRQNREDRNQNTADREELEVKITAFDVDQEPFQKWKDAEDLSNPTSVASLVEKYKVSSDSLKEIPSVAREAVAKALAKALTIEKPPLKLDSGKNIGGGQLSEQDKLDKLYPSMARK